MAPSVTFPWCWTQLFLFTTRCGCASLGRLQRGGDDPAADPGSVGSKTRPPPALLAQNWHLSCLLKLRTVIVGQKKLPARPSGRCPVPLWHGTHVSSSCSDAGRRPAAEPHALRLGSQTVSRQTVQLSALFCLSVITLFVFVYPESIISSRGRLLPDNWVLVCLTGWRRRFSGGIISIACLWSSSRLSSQHWQRSSSSSRMWMREEPVFHLTTSF